MALSRITALVVLGLLAIFVAVAVVTGLGSSDEAAVTTGSAGSSDAADTSAEPADGDAASFPDVSEAPAEEIETIAAPPILRPRPGLTGIDGWLQSDIDSLDDLDGQVYILEFWTFGCFNCRNVKPHLRALYDELQDDGLEIVGVHSPEFDFEKDVDAIQQAAIDQRVNWPIALDTEKTSFRAWQTERRFWPRTYVIDQNGDIRYDHIGEGAYDELGATVRYLLENGA